MSGAGIESVADRMTSEGGIDRAVALHVCEELMACPAYAAGDWMAQRLRKLETTLDVLSSLRRTVEDRPSVDRLEGVSRADFLRLYYAANRPVLLTDVASEWPALRQWTPEHFTDVIGDEEIEVMGNREANPRYEREAHAHKQRMPLRVYVEKILNCSPSNDTYLVANNHLLDSDAAKPLWQDFAMDERYLDPKRARASVFLWFGPEGTFTPLHHDVLNVLFVQVFGSKRFTLISPLESHCLANNVGVYSDIDARSPDPVRFPRFGSTEQLRLVVNPGESLFIPVGWWHCVEAIETSASLSFTNFAFPNSYTWSQPSIRF
jgi:ribosomal protein L16 Arg81 hydroxylase